MKKLNLRFDAIDFLRIIAMLTVLICHFAGMLDPNSMESISKLSLIRGAPAWSGVAIFFFISAYLNIIGFLKGKYSFTFKGIMKFYKTRLIKIIIDYYILVFLCIIIYYPNIFVDDLYTFFRLLFFFYNGVTNVVPLEYLGLTWFVSTIVQFYLICPLIAYLIYKIKDKKTLLIILFFSVLLLGQGIKITLLHFGVDWYKHIYTPIYGNLDFFVAGSLLYAINMNRKEGPLWLRISAVCIFIVTLYFNGFMVLKDPIFGIRYFEIFIILASSLLLVAFPTSKKKPYYYPSKIVTATSYDVYLIHPIFAIMIIHSVSNMNAFATISLMLAIILLCILIAGLWMNLKYFVRLLIVKIKDAKKKELTE